MKYKYSLSIIGIVLILALLCSIVVFSVGAENESTVSVQCDMELKERMEIATETEKIPVYIWYQDIDQTVVDNEVEKELSYNIDDISVDFEMPSYELIEKAMNSDVDSHKEIDNYLSKTKTSRAKEKIKTDNYLSKRRSLSRTEYNKKSNDILKEFSIDSENIIFNSQYAPMIIAELTVSQIEDLKKSDSIKRLSLFKELVEEEQSIDSAIETANVDMLKDINILGLTGEGIKVGIIENKSVRISQYEESGRYTVPDNATPSIRYTEEGVKLKDYGNVVVVGNTTESTEGTHADAVADTLFSVAPNITLYCSNTAFVNFEAMLSDGVQIISRSTVLYVYESDEDYAYTVPEMWFDHIISVHGVTVLQAAGNYGERPNDIETVDEDGNPTKLVGPRVLAPGMAYNVITVGAYRDALSGGYSEDKLYSYSSYRNSFGDKVGCEKPDVIAPATFNGGGTSNATPFLAGIVALMLDLRPSLAAYPQAIKAIVLASCHNKVVPSSNGEAAETMYQGITERQGAGAPDAWTMVAIVCNGTYGVGRIKDAKTVGIRRFELPSNSASFMNVSITWIRESYFEEGITHAGYGVSQGDYVDLNLSVYCGSNKVGESKLENSSTEMVYLDLDSNANDYTIRINEAVPYDGVVRYGYAYSTDVPYMTPSTSEGIYYIRNYYTDKYLTLVPRFSETSVEDFNGEDTQKWIIKEGNSGYEIYPAYDYIEGNLSYGEQVGSNPYYKAVIGFEEMGFELTTWEDDTTLEPDAVLFTSNRNGINDILGYNYTTGIYIRSANAPIVNMYRMWVLEDVNYRRGDANADGTIGIDDATYVQNYLNNYVSLNNIELFLADANYDGVVDDLDVDKINNIVSGIDLF